MKENLSPKTFKNRPIWPHCQDHDIDYLGRVCIVLISPEKKKSTDLQSCSRILSSILQILLLPIQRCSINIFSHISAFINGLVRLSLSLSLSIPGVFHTHTGEQNCLSLVFLLNVYLKIFLPTVCFLPPSKTKLF